MHTIKSKARQSAWYNRPGDITTYNPFGRTRTRTDRHQGRDEEAALTQVHSETCANPPSSSSREHNHEGANMMGGVPHANTMPPSSSPTDSNGSPRSIGEALEASEQPSSKTNLAAQNSSRSGATKRRNRILSKFSKHTSNPDTSEKEAEDSGKTKPRYTFANQIRATLFNSWINVLLICAPIGIIIANVAPTQYIAIFVVNFVAIIPLAAMLSYATEEIALRVGETLGGLLNASFGNAVELIVSIIALIQGEIVIVQTSLIGSILSNLLLVMGMCFFFGGLNRDEQFFNVTVAQTASSLLALAVGSLIIPTAFDTFATGKDNDTEKNIAKLSRGTSVILLLVYACYLFFQLKTHAHVYNAPSQKVAPRSKAEGAASKGIAQIGVGMAAGVSGQQVQDIAITHEEEEPEEPQLSLMSAVLTLCISTAFVGVCAEYLVGSIDALTGPGSPIGKVFVGLILLPIVGNAAEHATAVTVAIKDKMDLAIGVAVGSSMQIALLVIPFTVVVGWIVAAAKGLEPGSATIPSQIMTLEFDGFQIIVLFVAVLLVNYLIQDGKSHWLEGVLLMSTYVIIAIAAFFYTE
ncbi:MAG: vacuolar membrane-associated protein iml1 [Chaenotheca gracillima]|nr:MAG: vacuolar membrane-associated protein iml1 [Chaenotheca gracillima]